MLALDSNPRYYCYLLIDPRNGQPFYVGKGTNSGKNRMFTHEKEARAGIVSNGNTKLFNKIRSIHKECFGISYEIIQDNLPELDAYALEGAYIDFLGLDSLCNLVPGGIIHNPQKGKRHTEEHKARLRAINSTPEAIERSRRAVSTPEKKEQSRRTMLRLRERKLWFDLWVKDLLGKPTNTHRSAYQ
jgi:hypothetical protein